jgi:hypothetical protein
MTNREKAAIRAQLDEKAYQEWLNQSPIQFPPRLDSPIRNDCNNNSSSQVGNGVNEIEFGMDDYLLDTTVMETMLLDAFQNNERGDDAHITNTLFKILKYASATPLFGPSRSKSTQSGTTMLLYKLKARFGMSNTCFISSLIMLLYLFVIFISLIILFFIHLVT